MKSTTKGLRGLFPKTKPYRSGYLKVSKLHTIHFEECGNPRGKPLVFLHGGPGGGTSPGRRRWFDPDRDTRWRIAPALTYYPSEFSKLRLQYNYDDRDHVGVDHSVWLQFEFLLGTHAAHKF